MIAIKSILPDKVQILRKVDILQVCIPEGFISDRGQIIREGGKRPVVIPESFIFVGIQVHQKLDIVQIGAAAERPCPDGVETIGNINGLQLETAFERTIRDRGDIAAIQLLRNNQSVPDERSIIVYRTDNRGGAVFIYRVAETGSEEFLRVFFGIIRCILQDGFQRELNRPGFHDPLICFTVFLRYGYIVCTDGNHTIGTVIYSVIGEIK